MSSNLVSLWPKYGKTVLQGLYGLSDEDSVEILERQSRRKQGFGAFLRELGESLDTEMRLKRLPWENEDLLLLSEWPIAWLERLWEMESRLLYL